MRCIQHPVPATSDSYHRAGWKNFRLHSWVAAWQASFRASLGSASEAFGNFMSKNFTSEKSPYVMGYYSTQHELARHDSRAHVQQLTMFSTTPACFACHATRDVNMRPCTPFILWSCWEISVYFKKMGWKSGKDRKVHCTALTKFSRVLLAYRSMPQTIDRVIPAELMFNCHSLIWLDLVWPDARKPNNHPRKSCITTQGQYDFFHSLMIRTRSWLRILVWELKGRRYKLKAEVDRSHIWSRVKVGR